MCGVVSEFWTSDIVYMLVSSISIKDSVHNSIWQKKSTE